MSFFKFFFFFLAELGFKHVKTNVCVCVGCAVTKKKKEEELFL